MKVLIIHCSYKLPGGEDSVVFNEMKLLKSEGVTVDLLEFSNDKDTYLNILQLPFNVGAYRKTRKALAVHQPDVVHVHNLHYSASASVLYAIKKSRIPFVMTLHNYRLLCPSATLFFKGKLYLNSVHKQFPWDGVLKGVYRNSVTLTFWVCISMVVHQWLGTWKMASRYIVLTNHSKKVFLDSKFKFIADRIVVKPNFCYAVPANKFKLSDYFLYVGRLSEEKGVMLLLKTFSACDYKIKIVGEGPLEGEVRRYSEQFSNIEYLGHVKKDKVFNLLSNCSALIFPSLWYETFGMVVIEALSTGTPVIASKIGAMEYLICDQCNGMHFEPGNDVDLLDKLNKWQQLQENEKQAYRNNARSSYLEYYSPEKNVKQMLSIYQTVIDEQQSKVAGAIKYES